MADVSQGIRERTYMLLTRKKWLPGESCKRAGSRFAALKGDASTALGILPLLNHEVKRNRRKSSEMTFECGPRHVHPPGRYYTRRVGFPEAEGRGRKRGEGEVRTSFRYPNSELRYLNSNAPPSCIRLHAGAFVRGRPVSPLRGMTRSGRDSRLRF